MAKYSAHGVSGAHNPEGHVGMHGKTKPHHKMHEHKHYVGHEKVAHGSVMSKHHKMRSHAPKA